MSERTTLEDECMFLALEGEDQALRGLLEALDDESRNHLAEAALLLLDELRQTHPDNLYPVEPWER